MDGLPHDSNKRFRDICSHNIYRFHLTQFNKQLGQSHFTQDLITEGNITMKKTIANVIIAGVFSAPIATMHTLPRAFAATSPA
jgi:hypothetical protein